MDAPPHNLRPRCNVCPTDPIGAVVGEDGKRELTTMRWSKTIKDVTMATFNAPAETVETNPCFRDAFKRTRCLVPMSGYYEWQKYPGRKTDVVLHGARWGATANRSWTLRRVEGPLDQ